ncbi:Uncharacterised protein [Mycobacterium tuberculosis]|nr:Uncharacterised protein [Mycobacterium tuberculosis]
MIDLVNRYRQFIAVGIHNVQIIFMNTAYLKRSDAYEFPDSVVDMDDIIANLKLLVAFDAFGVLNLFVHLAGFALLLGEHFAFGNDDKMNAGQLKTGLQIPIHNLRLFYVIIGQYPLDSLHPFGPAGHHHHLGAGFFPAFHFTFEQIHLAMEILHHPAHEIDDVLRSYLLYLAQEKRHVQRRISFTEKQRLIRL